MTLSGTLNIERKQGVQFVFTVRNTEDEPIELRFRDGCTADFVLVEDGMERWRWSNGRLFTQALHSERLAPGEPATYEGSWSDPEPGEYTARATLCADNFDCRVERGFELSGENLSSSRS